MNLIILSATIFHWFILAILSSDAWVLFIKHQMPLLRTVRFATAWRYCRFVAAPPLPGIADTLSFDRDVYKTVLSSEILGSLEYPSLPLLSVRF
jgi:hypothetical protein